MIHAGFPLVYDVGYEDDDVPTFRIYKNQLINPFMNPLRRVTRVMYGL